VIGPVRPTVSARLRWAGPSPLGYVLVFYAARQARPISHPAAGVGKGTLYRRLPTREHLFAAILQDRVDELDASAQRALDVPDVWRALSEWLELYDRCATEYPGMSARVGESLSDDRSAVGTLCGPMRSSFARLFERARQEVPLRPDLTSTQLLSLVSALPKDARTGRTREPCLRVLDGLRA
jgi:AcrR family transcriptional regulator